jgi:hypothetical protein
MKDPKQEIKRLLDEHEESFAPWELDEGNCDVRPRENMEKFGVAAYNLAIEKLASSRELTELHPHIHIVIKSMKLRE